MKRLLKASREAKKAGLLVVIWSYARGENISKEGETAIDVIAYAAQVASQLGAHFVKVKPPSEHIEQAEAKKVFLDQKIPITKLSDRTKTCLLSLVLTVNVL